MAEGAGNGSRAYIGSFTAAGGRGVLTAAVDPVSGALTELHATKAVPDPSYLALAPTGETLYAVSETDEGAAVALWTGGDGLRPAGEPVPVAAAGPTHLALHGGYLLTANYGSGSVTTVPVRDDGSLGPRASVLLHEGSGPHPQRQQGPHAHQVQSDPSGRWVVSIDLGTDSVRVCTLEPAGKLKVHHETALRPGSGPRHLAFHPRGHRAYVLNELAPTLTVCRWNAAEGMLRPGPECAVLPDGVGGTGGVQGTRGSGSGGAGEAYPSALVVSPDGRFVWAAVRGADVIAVLALDADGDEAVVVDTVPCGGHWPRDLAADPAGRHLYAANERSGDVTWFTLDPATGRPNRGGSLPAPAASCVVFG